MQHNNSSRYGSSPQLQGSTRWVGQHCVRRPPNTCRRLFAILCGRGYTLCPPTVLGFVGAASASLRWCRDRMEAQAGIVLCLRAKHAARRPGLPGVGFAVGAARTTQLDQKRQPVAYTAGVSGTFAACRSTANAERNYEGGRASTWLRADLAGGYVPNKWWVACCSCWAPGHRSTTASGCALLSPRSGIVLGRRNWPPVPGCWTGSATRWAEGVLASSPRRFSWNSRADIFAQRCEEANDCRGKALRLDCCTVLLAEWGVTAKSMGGLGHIELL